LLYFDNTDMHITGIIQRRYRYIAPYSLPTFSLLLVAQPAVMLKG